MGHGHLCPIKAWSFPLRQVTIPSSQPYLDVQKESRTFTRLSTSTALSHYVFLSMRFHGWISVEGCFKHSKSLVLSSSKKAPICLISDSPLNCVALGLSGSLFRREDLWFVDKTNISKWIEGHSVVEILWNAHVHFHQFIITYHVYHFISLHCEISWLSSFCNE